MEMPLQEKWVVLRLNYPFIFFELKQLTGEYFKEENKINDAIVYTLLSYSINEDYPKYLDELRTNILTTHKANCKRLAELKSENILHFAAMKVFLESMKSQLPPPIFPPPMDKIPKKAINIFAQLFLNRVPIDTVCKKYHLDRDKTVSFFYEAIDLYKILLHGIDRV